MTKPGSAIQTTPGAPPQDGREYLASGNLGYVADECCTCMEPFMSIIHWKDGLWLDRRELSITRTLEDTLHFHNHAPLKTIGEDLARMAVELFEFEAQEAEFDSEND